MQRKHIIWIVFFTCLVIGLLIGGCPKYNIYRKEMKGKAALKEATWNKKIAVEAAKAKKESAQFEADADVIRAKGEAEANLIIGDSLKDNEERLRYLWIQNIKDSDSDKIYIPTEAGIPILEARNNFTLMKSE